MNRLAYEVGGLLASAGAVVITGGKDGVMEAAARGAREQGGVTVGVVKGSRRSVSNRYTDIEVLTGMAADGLDELLLVLMSDAVIAIGGGAGTLQEIALAYRNSKPIIALASSGGWAQRLEGQYVDDRKRARVLPASQPDDAVRKALAGLRKP